MNKKITVDPKVIAELANLAGIPDGPYPLIVSVDGVQFSSTLRKQFEHKIHACVYVAHFGAAMTNAKKIKSHKKIAELSRELVKAVKASDVNHLSHFLPRDSTVDSYIKAVNDLAEAAQNIGRLAKAKRRGTSQIVSRRVFVEHLLDAADSMGGKLGLNRRAMSGSLVKALDYLQPYLPPEFSERLSFSTLRRIQEAWRKGVEKKAKLIRN